MHNSEFGRSMEVKACNLYSKIQKYKCKVFARLCLSEKSTVQLEDIESPFMKLPVEVRQFIYSFLIPDMLVTTKTRGEKHKKLERERLRRDREPCCAALLRTNQKIYYELVEQWYTSTRYCILLDGNILRFAYQEFPLALGLPFGFRFLKRLDLTVQFIRYGSPHSLSEITEYRTQEQQKEAQQHPEILEGISNYFSPSGPGNLQDLRLYIVCGPQYFSSHVLETIGPNGLPIAERRAFIRESLKLNLHSLRKIRVSGSVRVIGMRGEFSVKGYFEEATEDVIRVQKEYFNRLETEILGAYDKAEV
jgi:hypothetical protein